MAKRFSDTEKWKKPFVRGLQAPYKLLWFYLLDDCDHAGIWQVDKEVAELRTGITIEWDKIPEIFGGKIIFFDDNEKWFIPDFVTFQYGILNPTNRVHFSVISLLEKNNLLNFLENNEKNKGLVSSLQGAKDKYKDKDKEKDKEKEGGVGETNFEILPETELEKPIVLPIDFELDEEEYLAAEKFFKSQSFYAITRKQHQLDDATVTDYFRRFYERRFAELQMERKTLATAYKTPMELIKHFYSHIPYLKKTIAETTPKEKSNVNRTINNRSNAIQYAKDFGRL